MERVELTNMCMVVDGSRVLVQRRPPPKWPGVAFPGGHVEEGEPCTDAVIREVLEETGLRIEYPRLVGVKDWIHLNRRYMVLCYRAERFSGSLRPSPEGEVFWAEWNELPGMDLADGMEETLRLFRDENTSEMWYDVRGDDWKLSFR